jgi:sugar/nucleoside kinase (ribokinase family)
MDAQAANARGRPVAGRRVVCLAEALVDLVCERPVASLAQAPGFAPRVGGSLVNIAAVAARFGAPAELLGGAGDDEWGRWLRERIGALGVGVERFLLAPGSLTSHAFVAVSPSGEPSYAFYSGRRRPAALAGDDLDPALSGLPGVLVIGTDTAVGEDERAVTARAAEIAGERGWLVLFDPNLRPGRWPSADAMLASAHRLISFATVVKCNADEAYRVTGEGDPPAATRALLDLGPRVAVVTRGREGALLAHETETVSVESPHVQGVLDTTGAGDSVAGVLAAALAAGLQPEELGRALPVALAAAAGVIGAWGALTGLPEPARARAALARII